MVYTSCLSERLKLGSSESRKFQQHFKTSWNYNLRLSSQNGKLADTKKNY